MDIEVRLPKLTLNVLEKKINDSEDPRKVLEVGLEEVAFTMYSESKPVYSLQTINLKNVYILDPEPPVSTMPYLLQLVLDSDISGVSSRIESQSAVKSQ